MFTTGSAEAALTATTPALSRWRVLFGAVLTHLVLGTVYGYGVFWQPLEQELWPADAAATAAADRTPDPGAAVPAERKAAPAAGARQLGYLRYSFALCLLSFATAMVFAGRLQDLAGPRLTTFAGGILVGLSFLTAAQVHHLVTFYVCHALLMGGVLLILLLAVHAGLRHVDRARYPSLEYLPLVITAVVVVCALLLADRYISGRTGDQVFLLWATLGVMAGAGIGFAYPGPIAALIRCFPAHRGRAVGLAVGTFGLGAFFFAADTATGARDFIEAHGIERFFTVHGLICVAVLSIGAWMLRIPRSTDTAALSITESSETEVSWQELLHSPRFQMIWVMLFSGALAGLTVLAAPSTSVAQPPAATPGGALWPLAACFAGLFAVSSAVGSVAWGWISERLGRLQVLAWLFVLQAVAVGWLSTLQTPQPMWIATAWAGFNFGGHCALFPALVADLFGVKHWGANYGWAFTAYGLAGMIGVCSSNLAQQRPGYYSAALALAAVLCLASAALAVWWLRQGPGTRRQAEAPQSGRP